MKKVFIIHGFNGVPNGGWRPWIMGELGKRDIYACALPMPNPDAPLKEAWVKTIHDAIGVPGREIFLVGHSLGVPAVLRYLETLQTGEGVGGAVLVSGPIFEIKDQKYEKVNKFLDTPFDFDQIKNVCKDFSVIHGADDPVVSFSNAEYLSENLNCDLVSIPRGGHLNGKSGWYELPPLLEALEKMF